MDYIQLNQNILNIIALFFKHSNSKQSFVPAGASLYPIVKIFLSLTMKEQRNEIKKPKKNSSY
jgi:hypothetical protein